MVKVPKFFTTFQYTEDDVEKTMGIYFTNISMPFFKACMKTDYSKSHLEEVTRYKNPYRPKEDS